MAEHPTSPIWAVDDLEARINDFIALTHGSATEAELQGHEHLDYLVNYLYPRYIALLEDTQRSVAAAGQEDLELLPALGDLEAQVIEIFNKTLQEPFYEAVGEGLGPPFYMGRGVEDERLDWLRKLMRDFRWLQGEPALQLAYSARLGVHFQWMQELIEECLPPSATRWVDGDLIGHPEFDGLWAEFLALPTSRQADAESGVVTEPNTDAENRRLVENSQNIVREAFDALLLKPKDLDVHWSDLQTPSGVPAYLEQPPYTDAFWEGAGDHDGAQLLMENLGWNEDMPTQSFRTTDESMLRAAVDANGKKIQFSHANKNADTNTDSKTKPTKPTTGNGNGNGNKRTGTDVGRTDGPATKKPRINPGKMTPGEIYAILNGQMEVIEGTTKDIEKTKEEAHRAEKEKEKEKEKEPTEEVVTKEPETEPETEPEPEEKPEEEEIDEDDLYTLDDALNDLTGLRADAGLGPRVPRGTELVTPTEPIREDALKRYRDELKRFARRHEDQWTYIQQQCDNMADRAEKAKKDPSKAKTVSSQAPSALTNNRMRSALSALEKALLREEEALKAAQEMGMGSAKLKAHCLSAWRSRYLRCLLLCLLALASDVPQERFDAAYERRLEDWIEHETAWNEQDEYAIEKLLKTEASKKEARERIARREENIKEWDAILKDEFEEEGGRRRSRWYVEKEDDDHIPGELPPLMDISLGPEYDRRFIARHNRLIRKKAPQDAEMAHRESPVLNTDYPPPLPAGMEEPEEMPDWTEKEKAEQALKEFATWGARGDRLLELRRQYLQRDQLEARMAELQKEIQEKQHEQQQLEQREKELGQQKSELEEKQLEKQQKQLEQQRQLEQQQQEQQKKTEKEDPEIPKYRTAMPEGPVLGSLTWDLTVDRPAKDPESAAKFAELGPGGYEGIPTNTVYEKLQYMIIMTLWRCQTAADTGL
ncbi:uncharacterized protein PG986_004696 [Apiospora aurea]|uniref:Uncharacterized protein n=1 Tax=Apiospora aurea TaxID=335848 RepID=A0ABR1QNC0_9PEZI